jgi:ATP-dependent Clp protease adapter protein ClpS
MGTAIIEAPDTTLQEEQEKEGGRPWNVLLYNDDIHTFNEVVFQIQKSTGVALNVAFEITMEAHKKGRAICYSGSHETCEKVAIILREIKLFVEVVLAER